MIDTFESNSATLDDPMSNIALVTPSDTKDLQFVTRGILINAQGTSPVRLTVTFKNNVTVTIYLAPGDVHWLRIKRIHATDTDFAAVPGIFSALW